MSSFRARSARESPRGALGVELEALCLQGDLEVLISDVGMTDRLNWALCCRGEPLDVEGDGPECRLERIRCSPGGLGDDAEGLGASGARRLLCGADELPRTHCLGPHG